MTHALIVPVLLTLLRLLFAAALLLSGVQKLRSLPGFRQTLARLGAPEAILTVLAIAVPTAEILIAIGLLTDAITARLACVALFAFSLLLTAVIARVLRMPEPPPCYCFGSLSQDPITVDDLLRAAFLTVGSLSMALEGPSQFPALIVSEQHIISFVPIFVLLLMAAAILNAVTRRAGASRFARLVLDSLDEIHATLTMGRPAPAFALEDLTGLTVSLQDLRGRAPSLALVFVDAACQACRSVRPALERDAERAAQQLEITLIASGSARDNTRAFGTSLTVLLDADAQVRSAYHCIRTPAAVLIGTDGEIASRLAIGPKAIEELLNLSLERSCTHAYTR